MVLNAYWFFGERAMELKCEKCDGKQKVTKYCNNCKKTFCHEVKTIKIHNIAPKLFNAITSCPECGSEEIVTLDCDLTTK
jgi:hypothetical protein